MVPAPEQPVNPEQFINTAHHAICARNHVLALDVLAIRDELARGTFIANLAIGRTIADRNNERTVAIKTQRANGFGLSLRSRQRRRSVVASTHAFLRPKQIIGDDVVGRDAKFRANRNDVIAEARTHDPNARRILLHFRAVPAETWRDALLQQLYDFSNVRLANDQHRESATKRFIDTDAPFHAITSDAFNRENLRFAIWVVSECEARDFIEAFCSDDRGIEIENELNGAGRCRRDGLHGTVDIGSRASAHQGFNRGA